MSRAAEEAHERWFKTHLEECVRDLVVGARVYRAAYDTIEEGEVAEIDRVRYSTGYFSSVQEIEDPNGTHVRYHAKFRDGAYGWESQTYQYRWFFKREDAQKRLAEQLRQRAKEYRAQADKWEALAAAQTG